MPKRPTKVTPGKPLGLLDIIGQQGFLLHLPDRVVGDIIGFAGPRELAIAYRAFMLLPRGEMFVFGDAGEGHVLVAIIHDRAPLIVALMGEPFEIQRAIAEAASEKSKYPSSGPE